MSSAQQRVPSDELDVIIELRRGWEDSFVQEVGDLEERGMLGELLDGITAIAKDALFAVDVGDGAFQSLLCCCSRRRE